MVKAIISPSILAADFGKLADEVKSVDSAEWIHVDVMDGHFVPNISLGVPVVESLRKHSKAYFDVHLMVSSPLQWIEEFKKAGADGYTFHYEALNGDAQKIRECCQKIRKLGMTVGMSVKPGTTVDVLFPFLDEGLVDLVLIMTVEPGFGGQKFMVDMMEKVRKVRAKYPEIHVEVDGGLNEETTKVAAEAGANVIVAGSAIFGASDRRSCSFGKFSPCGAFVATSVQHRLVVRDAESLQILHLFNNPSSATNVEWSADSSLVMAYSISKTSKNGRGWIRVYSIVDPEWHAEIDAGITGLVKCVFSPDGRHLMAWSEFQLTISIYSLIDSSVHCIRYPKSEKAFSFRSDGKYFAFCERTEGKDFLGVVSCDNWELVKHFPTQTSDLDGLQWSPDGKFLSVCENRLSFQLQIYTPDGRLVHVYKPEMSLLGICNVKWSPSSQLLAIYGFDQKITILNSLTWFPSLEIHIPSSISNSSIPIYKETSLTPNNNARFSSQYHLAQYPFAPELNTIKEFPNVNVEWSPCGKYLAFKSELYPSTIFIYDLAKLDFVAVLAHLNPIKLFQWNPVFTNQLVLACHSSANIYMWTPTGCSSIAIPSAGFELVNVHWNCQGKSLFVSDKEKFCVAFPVQD